jgi:hypothetical protein
MEAKKGNKKKADLFHCVGFGERLLLQLAKVAEIIRNLIIHSSFTAGGHKKTVPDRYCNRGRCLRQSIAN